MRSRAKALLIGLAIFSSMGIGPCGSSVSGPIKYGGYVKSLVTDQVLTNYLLEVETANGIAEADFDDETGKFEFSTPVGVDYVVKVTAEGFRTFTSTNRRTIVDSTSNEEVMELNEHQTYLFNVPMIPTSITSPAIDGQVIDAGTGAAITSGAYRIAKSAVSASFDTELYDDDGVAATGVRWWLADAPVLAGALVDGTFTVPQNGLMPGYTYTMVVFGAAGYRDHKTSFTIGTGGITAGTDSINTAQKVAVQLEPYSNPSSPILIGQSNAYFTSATTSSAIPIGSDRVITLVFDRNIVMDKRLLQDLGTSSLLTLATPVNNDEDGVTTGAVLETESGITSGGYSQHVSIAASGNKITITLAPDTSLIASGVVDTDDDLQYALTATLTNGIQIRDASSPFDTYTTLTATPVTGNAALNTTVMIRGNWTPTPP